MTETTKNTLIGLFVLAACCLVIALILFLKPDVGDGKKILHVRFSNINKINEGTRVLYAGKPVGEVVSIQELSDAREEKTDSLGRLYFYDLTLKLDSKVQVFSSDQVAVVTAGLLGEKSVAITPMPQTKQSVEIVNEPVYANSIDPLEQAFNQLSQVAHKMDATLGQVNNWLIEYGNTTGAAIESFGASMGRIDTAVSQMIEQQTFLHTGEIAENIKKISQTICEGKGTVGKLIAEDGFYLKAEAILSKMDTLMTDINHYGILFHLNKGWQRLRTQRMNAFGGASSPEDYTSLFQSELSELNTSMARLALIADKMENETGSASFTKDKIFIKEFSDLLNRSTELTNKLKLFNEQMMENYK